MAKNITIKDDGVAESYEDVSKITTKNIDSGSTDWIPEDDCATGIKYITSNGAFNASEDNLGGYTAVIINVSPTQVTGIDPETGEAVTVTTDNDGNIIYLPVGEGTEFNN